MNVPTCFVDTNVLVRYLTADDAQKAEAVEQLLVQARDGEVSLITSDIVIAELVWVLSSFYKLENAIITELLRAILNTEGFKVDNSDVIEVSLDIYETESIDFIDAYIIGYMRLKGLDTLYSYDKKHLSKFAGIKRIEP
jgi:predicted nucleic-acid-binding protein